jgi:hypothetical protein
MTIEFTPTQANQFIPNPYTPGAWYPVSIDGMRDGVQVSRSKGMGRNSGKHFIKVRYPVWQNIVDPSGVVIQAHSAREYKVYIGRDNTWELYGFQPVSPSNCVKEPSTP